MNYSLRNFKRIVIKIGSALLVEDGTLRHSWLQSLIEDLDSLRSDNIEFMMVSSGAIALGRNVLNLDKKNLSLVESQASAAVGQIKLCQAYSEILATFGLHAGQILLTLSDTEERRRYLNARETINTLFQMKSIPIVNENDTVATSEIRYGDNDRLAARVATMVSADLLILLSDVKGLYSASPVENQTAELIPTVTQITPEIEAMAGNSTSDYARGGMKTKIDAAKIATGAGTTMVIASGKENNPLKNIESTGIATWFPAPSSPQKARKSWIHGHLETKGSIQVDSGAVQALRSGKSLLTAGVIQVTGNFSRGDAVAIITDENTEIGRGLIAYDFAEATKLARQKSQNIKNILGYEGRAEMIHRDNLVMNSTTENN